MVPIKGPLKKEFPSPECHPAQGKRMTCIISRLKAAIFGVYIGVHFGIHIGISSRTRRFQNFRQLVEALLS